MRATEYQKGHQTHLDVQYTARKCDAGPQDESEHPWQQTAPFDA